MNTREIKMLKRFDRSADVTFVREQKKLCADEVELFRAAIGSEALGEDPSSKG